MAKNMGVGRRAKDIPESKYELSVLPVEASDEWQIHPIHALAGCQLEYPVNALGIEGARAARAIHRLSRAPLGICGKSVLGAMSCVTSLQGRVKNLLGEAMPRAVMLNTVALSGERKSTCDSYATSGIVDFERWLSTELVKRAREKQTDHVTETSDQGSPETAEIMCSDLTIEGLIPVIKSGCGTTYLTNDDAASFWGGYSMSTENRQKTIAILSQLFSGSRIRIVRASKQNILIEDPRLTSHLMFQPYLVAGIYGTREMTEQGILARMFPCYPSSTIGTRFFSDPEQKDRDDVGAFRRRCMRLLTKFFEESRGFEAGTGAGHPILRDHDLHPMAREVMIEFYNDIEAKIAPGGEYEKIQSFASRATENAIRIASIRTAFDDPETPTIPHEAADGACCLMRFYLGSFQHLLKGARKQGKSEEACILGQWMLDRVGPWGCISDRELSQHSPQIFRKKEARRLVLDVLIRHGWIKQLPSKTTINDISVDVGFQVHAGVGQFA